MIETDAMVCRSINQLCTSNITMVHYHGALDHQDQESILRCASEKIIPLHQQNAMHWLEDRSGLEVPKFASDDDADASLASKYFKTAV